MNKKLLSPKVVRVNPSLIRSYLLCAPFRHPSGSSVSSAGATVVLAANTFRSLKQQTSSRPSVLQNQSAFPWLPTSPSIGQARWPFDDHHGTRFAKVREGLKKVLLRRGIPPAWAWCRECKAHTDTVHCHLLFHLPIASRTGPKLDGIKAAIERLVDRHGDGILGEFAVTLKIWPDPDGLYLIKSGGANVWERFPRIRKDWRKPQGIIHGKRCGVSQNLGPAARLPALMQTETARSPLATLKTPSR